MISKRPDGLWPLVFDPWQHSPYLFCVFLDPFLFFVHLRPPGFETVDSEIVRGILLTVVSDRSVKFVTVCTLHCRNDEIPFNSRFDLLVDIYDLSGRDSV